MKNEKCGGGLSKKPHNEKLWHEKNIKNMKYKNGHENKLPKINQKSI